MKTRNFLPASLAAVMTLVTSAVSAQVVDTTTTHTTVTTKTTITTSAPDSSVVITLIAANQKEVAEAELAINRAESDRVKEFARRLQQDHAKAVEDLQSYLHKSRGGMSSGLSMDSTKPNPPSLETESYQGLTGKAFDKAWLDAIEDEHQQAVDDLRNAVIPNVQDPSLKSLLEGLLPVMENHLREAAQIESELK